MTAPFWKDKTLDAMTPSEWESVCDGCGKCCLHKLQDEQDDRIHLTVVACRLLDVETCRCSNYAERKTLVPECTQITPANVRSLTLPHSCAYRTLAEGRELPDWHPLVSGSPETVHEAHASARGWAISANDIDEDDLDLYVVAWANAGGEEG